MKGAKYLYVEMKAHAKVGITYQPFKIIILFCIFFPFIGISHLVNALPVKFPQKEIDRLSGYVYSILKSGEPQIPVMNGLGTSLNAIRKGAPTSYPKGIKMENLDTLIIGDTPGESLTVTGIWFHNGPIFVLGDGVLRFRRAQATNIGNLYILGRGKVLVDSSRLSFPQQYWYERALVITENGFFSLCSCTTNFGGYPYNLVLGNSGYVEMKNVYHQDFTTGVVSGKSSLIINKANLTGEYIMTDSATAHFKNTTFLLIWHHLPSSAVINFTFPSGDTVYSYRFNESVPGVDGIKYRITVDSSYEVMWGMMPSKGSNVRISNSRIRSIGVWFEGRDTMNVSGLVNNINYTDFTAPLSDRTLRLINTFVQTWSLYPFDMVNLNVSGCILGEVLTQKRSFVILSNYFLDGSGGYLGATDTSVIISFLSAITSNIRSERYALLILGYSAVPWGQAIAIGNSQLIVVQSSLPEDPIPLEGSVAWFGNIAGPSHGAVGDVIPITGSAWIDRGPQHNIIDFRTYQMFYQRANDTIWRQITSPCSIEVRNDTLAFWNTRGLEPGNYILRLVLKNNFGDSVDAMKSVTLRAVGATEIYPDIPFNLSARPHSGGILIDLILKTPDFISITASDILGREVKKIFAGKIGVGQHQFTWCPPTSGIYFIHLNSKPTKRILWIKR